MKWNIAIGFFLLIGIGITHHAKSQVNPSVEELHDFFNNQQLLITYRDGEALYGTYYFLEIHYCPNGYYGLYGRTVKRTVLGNEQGSNWQEFGTWQISDKNGINGIHYTATNGNQQFYPLYRLDNGNLFISDGISIVKQGLAICQ